MTIGDWIMRYYPPAKKCKLDSPWLDPYLLVSIIGWAIGVQLQPDSPALLVHCQDSTSWAGVLAAVRTDRTTDRPASPGN